MTMTTAALLSSCGLYKSYERPADIQTDGLYRSDNTQSSDSLGLASFAWREIFTDPQLQTLIERGLAQNTNLRSAQLQIEQSEASLKAAKWAYIPSLAFAPQGSLAGVDWGKATQTYTIPVSASWQIDIFGSLHNAKKRAQAQLENSQAYKQAVQSQLIAAIANYYYSLAMLKDQLAISQETEKLWKVNVETTRALMNAGQSNMAAVSQTEANYYSICTQITDLKQQISDLENEFSALLGEAPQKYAIGSMNNWKVPARMSAGIGQPSGRETGRNPVGRSILRHQRIACRFLPGLELKRCYRLDERPRYPAGQSGQMDMECHGVADTTHFPERKVACTI